MKRIIKCSKCGEIKPHAAFGLCQKCYSKNRLTEKRYKNLIKNGNIFLTNDGFMLDLLKYCKNQNTKVEMEVITMYTKQDYFFIKVK